MRVPVLLIWHCWLCKTWKCVRWVTEHLHVALWACALVNSPTACNSCLLPQLSPHRPPERAGTGRRNVTWRGRKMFLQLCLRFERVELDWTRCLCHRSLCESAVLALTAPLFLCCLCIRQNVFFFFLAGEGEKVRDLFSPYKQRGPSSSNYCGSASCRCGVTRRFPIGCYKQIKTQKWSVIRVERKPEVGAITTAWQHQALQLLG